MNVEEISRIAELMEKYHLNEFSAESEDMKLSMKRNLGSAQEGVSVQPDLPVQSTPAPQPQAATPEAAQGGKPEEPSDETTEASGAYDTINAPIVGTFYAAPSPDAETYVKPGDEVQEDSVVCIIEAMKVMNEIKAEKRGIIRNILVENAAPVEYGHPLFEIEPID